MKYCIIYDSQIPARSTSTWVLSFKLGVVQDSQETANNVAVSIWLHFQTFSSKVAANIFYFQSTNRWFRLWAFIKMNLFRLFFNSPFVIIHPSSKLCSTSNNPNHFPQQKTQKENHGFWLEFSDLVLESSTSKTEGLSQVPGPELGAAPRWNPGGASFLRSIGGW